MLEMVTVMVILSFIRKAYQKESDIVKVMLVFLFGVIIFTPTLPNYETTTDDYSKIEALKNDYSIRVDNEFYTFSVRKDGAITTIMCDGGDYDGFDVFDKKGYASSLFNYLSNHTKHEEKRLIMENGNITIESRIIIENEEVRIGLIPNLNNILRDWNHSHHCEITDSPVNFKHYTIYYTRPYTVNVNFNVMVYVLWFVLYLFIVL